MARLSASVEGLDEVIAEFSALEGQIDRASRRAVNKTAKTWAAGRIARGVAADDQVPLRVLTRDSGRNSRRVRVRLAKRGGTRSGLWLGYNPVKAAYVGAMEQQKRGARAGKHLFERAFVATMKSGHRGVYLRTGAGRFPIEEQSVPLHSAARHVASVAGRVPARLAEVLRQELNYEVNVRGAG